MRKLAFAAFVLAGCKATDAQPPPVVAVPTQPPQQTAAVQEPTTPPAPPMTNARLIMWGGSNQLLNAAWVGDVAAAVSRTDVWAVKPEEPERVHRVPLAAPLGSYDVVTASEHLFAAGLEDGTVDIFGDTGRKRTIPAGPKIFAILMLRISPDEKTIAVTRNGPTWKDETTFYDLETGNVRGKIEGGKVVFDPTSKFVAGRGGVSSIEGKSIFKWAPGFLVLDISGRMIDINASTGEVMAADNVARGWYGNQAIYPGDKGIVLVDPTTGKTTSIPAPCLNSSKLISTTDSARHRVIGVCQDGIVVTDLDTKASTRIQIAIQAKGQIFPPTVTLAEGTSSFLVRGSGASTVFVDPSSNAHVANYTEESTLKATAFRCVRQSTARSAIACDMPALRRDNKYKLEIRHGVLVTTVANGAEIVNWTVGGEGRLDSAIDKQWVLHGGILEIRDRSTRRLYFRFDGKDQPTPATRSSEPAEPFSASGCGTAPVVDGHPGEWHPHERTDEYGAFTAIRVANSRVTSNVVCACSAKGCVTSETPDSPIAIDADGSVLTTATNPTMTESTLALHHPKQAPIKTKLPYSCIYGAFGPNGRVFLDCRDGQRNLLVELAASNLSVVGKRIALADGRVARVGDELVLEDGNAATFLPLDWAKDPTKTELATGFISSAFAARLGADGKLRIVGNEDAAAQILRCFDGEYLKPLSACR
jgi:hypothetical protein